MLSGVKFIPKDQIPSRRKNHHKDTDSGSEDRENSKNRKWKSKRSKKRKSSCVDDLDSDDSMDKISKKGKKKWYASDEDSATSTSESYDRSQGIPEVKRHGSKNRKSYNRDLSFSSSDEAFHGQKTKLGKERTITRDEDFNVASEEIHVSSRNEMGLGWMTKGQSKQDNKLPPISNLVEECQPTEKDKPANPRELNPYLKDNGTGYPDEESQGRRRKDQLAASSVVGDGGASWRLKALKRAREQAVREGKKIDEVVEERWGSMSNLAISVASHKAAPDRAHLHAIYDRKRGQAERSETHETSLGKMTREKGIEEVPFKRKDYLQDVSSGQPQMKKPKFESFSWKKEKGRHHENTSLISDALSNINKFSNDGSFMEEMVHSQKNVVPDTNVREGKYNNNELESFETNTTKKDASSHSSGLSSNQLAAKALQLRLRGKHEEAEKLLKEVEAFKQAEDTVTKHDIPLSRSDISRLSGLHRSNDDDIDLHLARKVVKNKQYSMSKRADDEYDYDDDAPVKKQRHKSTVPQGKATIHNRLLTQKERCQFCIDNPTRPKHLIVSIAQFTYMMLPSSQPVVQGHCCILPMQHESSARNIDDDVWEEIRNFKKCLLMMFAKEEKGVIFLETVMGLAKQQRHCLVECIPIPQELAKQAPLYFKKAIDEAEDEWSQHNAKKLIRTTREKGLRRSVPKDFPYFHVEFGLDEGFVHVIDDETKFKSSMGLNVIRGMLKLPEEDMHRRRRHESVEKQKLAVASFARNWEHFDWTKQLA